MSLLRTLIGFVFLLSLAGGEALAAQGGLSGTGDSDFDPASDTEGNHCVNAAGFDLNAVLVVSEQIVAGRCGAIVNSGEFYVPYYAWYTNLPDGIPGDPGCPHPSGCPAMPVVYPSATTDFPEPYVPDKDAPMEDFLSKLESVRYILDGHKEYIYPGEDIVKLLTLGDIGGNGPPMAPLAVLIAKLNPASIGVHRVQMILNLSKIHCDGLGTNWYQHCLPPGELMIPIATRNFEVVPGAAQSQ